MDKNNVMINFIYKLTGNPFSVILERRILKTVCIVSVMICIILFIQALILDLSLLAAFLPFFIGIVYFVIYRLSRGNSDSNIPALVFIFITGLLILSLWFFLRGARSLAVPVYIVITGIIPVLIKDKSIIAAYLINILVMAVMFVSGYQHPEITDHMFSDPASFSDWMLDRIFLSIGLSGMLFMIMHSYRCKVEETIDLNATLASQNTEISTRNYELKKAMEEINALRGIIPICSYCHKVRTDAGYVESVEAYIARNSKIDFTHTCCPECLEKYFSGNNNINAKVDEDAKNGDEEFYDPFNKSK